jgi:hypothetical protein
MEFLQRRHSWSRRPRLEKLSFGRMRLHNQQK